MSGEHVRSARGFRAHSRHRNPICSATRSVCEQLETRRLLSTINWANKGTAALDTDGFNAAFGANSTVARGIVQRAIDDWERVIVNFNYSGGGNTYSVNISSADLGPGTRGSTGGIAYNAQQKPTSGNITIDDNGGGSGWYFDPVVGSATVPDDGEFTTINTPFQANAAVAGFDLYRTAAHELGHAMGLASTSPLLQAIDINIGDDPVDGGSADLFTIDVDGNPGADYCYTNAGGFHLYEGPSVGGNPIHPNDIMNSGRTAVQGRRQLISDTIASLLRDAYTYTVTLPSFINTFYANLNTSTNVVTITGDIDTNGDDADVIDLEVDGTAMSFEVNGTDEVIEGAQFTTIVVNAGLDNDDVDVDELLASKSVTVNGGDGNDNISAAQELQDIDTDLDSNFTANGNAGTDTLVFNDQADAVGGDDYTFTSTTFTKNASFIDRVITYGTFESLIVNGSAQPSTYDVNSLNTSLTINAGAANDIITVGGTVGDIDTAVNANVIVHGNGGTDSLIYNDATDDATVDDTYTLTSLGFDKSSTTETFGFDTVEHVTLTAGLADNTIDVLSMSGITSDVTTLVVNGSDGNDAINLGTGDLEIDLAFTAVTVNGGVGDDSLYLDDSDDAEVNGDSYTITSTTFDKNTAGLNLVTFNTMEDVSLDCGIVDNTINIDTFSTQVAADLQTLLVNGNGGNDTFNLGTGDLETNLAFTAVSVNGNAGTDSLVADDGGDGEGDDIYTVTSTTLDKNTVGLTNPITYGTFENVNLTCNTFDNTINVTSTLAGCTYSAGGNTGNDVFNVGSPGNNADNIDGFISLSGGAGTDAYNYNDSANAVAQTYTVTLNNMNRSGTAGTGYTTMESLTVNCGAGADTINVASTLAGIPTVVNGNGGNDTMLATTTGDWDGFINGNLTFNGNANIDVLRINDTADLGADNYTVTATQTTKTSVASVIAYATIENYTLDANGDINTITVNSSFAAPFRVNGNGAVDTINLVDNAAGSFVTIDGGAGLDNVTVNSDAAGIATAHFDVTQDLAALTILGGGTAVMELNGSRVIDTDALTVAATGKLDLTDNDMIVDYAGASQLAVVQALINLGRNSGGWNGNGITSTAAGSNAQHNTTLGAMESSEFQSIYGVGATFDGRIIDSSAVLVKYTYYGDADFNGRVNFDDYVRTDNGFNNHQNHWVNGDYDGNGSVNFDDYVLIDLAFNTQAGTL